MMFLTEKTAIIQSKATVQKILIQIAVSKIFIRESFEVNFQNILRILLEDLSGNSVLINFNKLSLSKRLPKSYRMRFFN